MQMIDLVFPIIGDTIPSDHGFDLYAAISRLVPSVHGGESTLRIATIRGDATGTGLIRLKPDRSRLRLRVPTDQIPALLQLSGKPLAIANSRIRLGVPQVHGLIPAPSLHARLVVIKASSPQIEPKNNASRDRTKTQRYLEPAAFLDAAKGQLAHLEIAAAQASIPLVPSGPHSGKPTRRILRIHGKKIVGFSLIVEGLTAEESILLQEKGLGGRGKMGCGFFVPIREVK